ncbi:MAG: hypothetical protein ACREJC_10735, partial [Tepidisphaeraceae bacterium]
AYSGWLLRLEAARRADLEGRPDRAAAYRAHAANCLTEGLHAAFLAVPALAPPERALGKVETLT